MNSKKGNKIYFDEDIDRSISGYSLSVTLLITGLFLMYNPNYFGNDIVTSIFRWIFIVIGGLGFFIEFGKSSKKIVGVADLGYGLIIIAVATGFIWTWNNPLIRSFMFFLLIVGLFGANLGIFRIVYSLRLSYKTNEKSKGKIASDIILMLTQIGGLCVLFLQFIKAMNEL